MDSERVRPALTPTGDPRVDAAVQRLASLEDEELAERPAVLEGVHDRLREILGELGDPGRPGPAVPARPGEPGMRGEQGELSTPGNHGAYAPGGQPPRPAQDQPAQDQPAQDQPAQDQPAQDQPGPSRPPIPGPGSWPRRPNA